MQSEHDSEIAGDFGRERMLELVMQNFYYPNMETDIRKYCNECDNCQRKKSPRHAKLGLLYPLELAGKQWSHISMDFITDLPESEGATLTLVVVDQVTKMAHFCSDEEHGFTNGGQSIFGKCLEVSQIS